MDTDIPPLGVRWMRCSALHRFDGTMTAHFTPKPRSETPKNPQPQAAPELVPGDGVVHAPLLRRLTAGPGARLSPRDVHALQPLIGNRAVVQLLARGGGPVQASRGAVVPDAGGNKRPGAPSRGEAMPKDVQDQMESVFDADFSAVRVHEGPQPAAVEAIAFTEGTDIHIAPGLYQPHCTKGLELLGHELAHVVQQSQGRVRATMQAKGVGINDDRSLEQEADECGVRAARGEHVAAWLGPMGAAAPVAQRKVIQRAAVKTDWGTFKDEHYTTIFRGDKAIGVDMHLSFEPNDRVDAKKIGLVQSVRSMDEGEPEVADPEGIAKVVPRGPAAGYETDRRYGHNNPVFGADFLGKNATLADTPLSDAPEDADPAVHGEEANASYVLGYRYENARGKIRVRNAELHDAPKIPQHGQDAGQEFETAALALDGQQKGSYYGSVAWGWRTDKDGTFSKIDLSLISEGIPSAKFIEPAGRWNEFEVKEKVDLVDTVEELEQKGGKGGKKKTVTKKFYVLKTTEPMTVWNTHENPYRFTLAAGNEIRCPTRVAQDGGRTMTIFLGQEIHLRDGSDFWMCKLPADKLRDNEVTEDCTIEMDVGDDMESLTVKKGSTVERRRAPAEDGTVMVCLKEAKVSTASNVLRQAEAMKLEIRGGRMVPLPIPTAESEPAEPHENESEQAEQK
jgi:hypothetical protein